MLEGLSSEPRQGRCEPRPIRIAFLIQAGEHAHLVLDGIFADCFGRWGGRFSLIVPCEQDAVPASYWPWLFAYDPDVVYSYVPLDDEAVLQLHERLGPSVYQAHRLQARERLSFRSFSPSYGAAPLQSLSTIFKRSRYRDHRSTVGPLPLIDSWHTEQPSRFLTDNFGTYHGSYGTGSYPPDARAAAQLLTIVDPGMQADRRYGIPQDLLSVSSEIEAFKEFGHRRASSLAIASMDFATKLDVRHGRWSGSFSLIVGGDFQDRVMFWNSRLLHHNWIGADLGSFRVELGLLNNEEFFSALVTMLNERNFVNSGSGGQPQLTLLSTTVPADELSALADRLRAARCWSVMRTHFVPDISAMIPSDENLQQGSPSSALGSAFNLQPRSNQFSWTGLIAAPVTSGPEHLADVPYRQSFATGAWASDYLLDNAEPKPRFSNGNVWRLPRRWRMSGAFKAEFTTTSRSLVYPARSSRTGELTLFESQERRVRSIYVPTGVEAIHYALLEDGRWQRMPDYKGPVLPRSTADWIEPSNEARYLNGVVGMAGDLDQASRFLLHPFIKKMFATLGGTPNLPPGKVQPTVARLERAGRNRPPFNLADENEREALGTLIVKAAQSLKSPLHYLRYGSITEQWQRHRADYWARTGKPDDHDENVNWDDMERVSLDDCLIAMRHRQMVFQGHEWVCPECHHRNWVDMAELRPVLTCAICRHSINAPIAFDWLFRPSTFLIEALRDHSALSLLWALAAIRDRGHNAFSYTGPTWFWYEDRDVGPDAEADLLVVIDGSTIVAEVKSSWTGLRKADIAALGEIAKRLRPDVALLAVMDTGQQHVDALRELHENLAATGVVLEIMTLDTHPLHDDPYLL